MVLSFLLLIDVILNDKELDVRKFKSYLKQKVENDRKQINLYQQNLNANKIYFS